MNGSSNTPLGEGAEFDAVRAMIARWGPLAAGIGDDAAVLDVPRGDRLVASVDAAMEGRHFVRGWLTPREIGDRAVTAALSDLAAMAARPLAILVALALPDPWRAELDALADGIGDAARRAGARIAGGNTVAAAELSITTTVLGHVFRPMRRDGLAAGDHLFVTGTLGGPAAAVRALVRGATPDAAHRARFARPSARIAEARWLADRGATACIDVSDGLAADLGHLAAASGVSLDVELDELPRVAGVSPLEAAAGGEEYELVVGTRDRDAFDIAEFARSFGIPLTRIGAARSAVPRGTGEVALTLGGRRVAVPRGYDHLSE